MQKPRQDEEQIHARPAEAREVHVDPVEHRFGPHQGVMEEDDQKDGEPPHTVERRDARAGQRSSLIRMILQSPNESSRAANW